jgi:PAS domain S-box-containing protein
MQTSSVRPTKTESALLNHFDGYLWSVDLDSKYTYLNKTLADTLQSLTGVAVKPGDEMLDFPGILDPSMPQVWEKVCRQGFRGESRRMMQEFSIKGQSAFFELSVTPIRKEGEITGLSCFARDLTTEIRTVQNMPMSEIRFRSLIEKGSDIIVVVGGEGRIVYCSPSIEHYFGISDAENLGKNAFDYIHPDDLSRLAESFIEVLDSPGKAIAIEARALAKALGKDAQLIWVEGTVTNLLATEGINGIVCNFRDVTARKKAESLAKESEDHARRLENLLTEEKILQQRQILQATIDAQEKEREEIGRELHDNVNQILTTARLYLDCIDEPSSTLQPIIKRSSDIITTAIEEIRKLSKSMTQSFHREIGLQLSVEDLVESIRRLAEDIEISLDFYLPDELVLEDKLKTAVFRIIQEQLNNVLKHAGAGKVQVSISQESDSLLLQVTDDGKGFDLHKKRDGIGINNIINRAEVFGGRVIFDTAPEKGCSLFISFPLADG